MKLPKRSFASWAFFIDIANIKIEGNKSEIKVNRENLIVVKILFKKVRKILGLG